MSSEFDPYYEWLGIPRKDQPPNHYRLLGIELFEQNLNVIERAADRQMRHVRSYQSGSHSRESQQLLNELSAAKLCLLNPQRKEEYDQPLRQKQSASQLPDFGLPDAAVPELPPSIPSAGVSEFDAISSDAPVPLLPSPGVPAPIVVAAGPAIDVVEIAKRGKSRGGSPDIAPREPDFRNSYKKQKQKRRLVFAAVALMAVCGVAWVFWLGPTDAVVEKGAGGKSGSDAALPTDGTNSGNSESPAKISESSGATSPPPDNPPAGDARPTDAVVGLDESIAKIEDPSSVSADPSVPTLIVETIAGAAGTVNPRFAFCQTLLWTRFEEVHGELRKQGYRLSRCRPYRSLGDWRVAAIWLRDGQPARVVALADAATVAEADRRLREQGFIPVDCMGAADGLMDQFTVVWVQPKFPVGAVALSLGVRADASQASSDELTRQGFHSAVHLIYFDAVGTGKYCDLWIKPVGAQESVSWAGNQADTVKLLAEPGIQADISVAADPATGEVVYTGSHWEGAKDDVRPLVGLSPEALRLAAVEQATAGTLPASLSVASAASGELTSVALWRRPGLLQSPLELASLERASASLPEPTPVTPSTAAPEHAIRFAGQGCVTLKDSAGLANIGRDFTIDMWLRFNEQAFGATNILCGTGAYKGLHPDVTTVAMKGWLAGIKPARNAGVARSQFILQWAAANGESRNFTGMIPAFDDQWHQLTLCNRAAETGWEMVVYLDGHEAWRGSHADAKDLPSFAELSLGRSPYVAASRRAPQGLIRAFRLSSGVRNAADFSPESPLSSDAQTLALLDFSDAGSRTIGDRSGHGRSGELTDVEWVDLEGKPLSNSTSMATSETVDSPNSPFGKRPPPSDAAGSKIRELYKAEIAAAKDSRALVALAEKLLVQAAVEADDPMQFALLTEARRLAAEGADWHLAARIIGETTSRFSVDPWSLKAEVLTALTKKVKVATERKILAETAVAQAESALEEGALESIEPILSSASNLTPRGERDLGKQISDLRRRVGEEKKAQVVVADARAKLEATPDDPAANETIGKYLCFTKLDFELGIPHLAKAPAGKLTSQARNDEARPTEAEARLALATSWAEYARSSSETTARGGAASRALHWYQLALPELAGVQKVQAEKQVEELAKWTLPARGGKARFPWLDGQPGFAMEVRGHTADVTCLAVSRSGRFVVSGSLDDTIRLWDLATGKQSGQISPNVGDIQALLLSSDDRTVAIPFESKGVYSVGVWSVQNGQLVGSIKADNAARLVAGSLDWRRVVYAKGMPGPGNLLIYNLATMAPFAPLGFAGIPMSIAVSRNGKYLAVADENNLVHLWDIQAGKKLPPLTGHAESVRSLAFSPNERQLVSCGARTLIIWDSAKGTEERRITLTDRLATAVTVSADGSRLLVAGTTAELSLFALRDGSQIAPLQAPPNGTPITNTRAVVSFPDSRAAAVIGYDGVIRIWRLPP